MKIEIDTRDDSFHKAIAVVRSAYGMPDTAVPMPSSVNLGVLTEAFGYVIMGQKIRAIKSLRTAIGCGLKEAKDCVEGGYPYSGHWL